jgi:hypothetical protein
MLNWLLIIFIGLPLVALAAGQLGLLRGTAPADLGLRDGKLKAPANSPNSVSSQTALWPNHPQAGYAAIGPSWNR